jgi:cell division protein FtsL
VKYGVTHAAYHFLSAFGLFVTILLLTCLFILYQWKNVKIRSHLESIDQCKQEVLQLNAEVIRLEIVRNELISKIPEVAENKLEMFTPTEPPKKLAVNRRKFVQYGQEE